jgi:hypothetical protein
MKKPASRQRHDMAETPAATSDLKIEYTNVMIFQEAGKTILQPLTTNQEIQELFQNNTLEVWLSNGQPDPDQFDLAILNYKQTLQPLTRCRTKTGVCSRKNFQAIVSCGQCSLSNEGAQE